jgi:hypothetical protein
MLPCNVAVLAFHYWDKIPEINFGLSFPRLLFMGGPVALGLVVR